MDTSTGKIQTPNEESNKSMLIGIENNVNNTPIELSASVSTDPENDPNTPNDLIELVHMEVDEDENNSRIKIKGLTQTEPENSKNDVSSEINDSAQIVPERCETNKQNELKETLQKQSEIDQNELPGMCENVNDSAGQSQQTGKSLIDRIAFEVPIITEGLALDVHTATENIPEEAQPKNVKSIFTEVTGPTLYEVKSTLVTLPIITKNLPECFASLPIFGAPKNKEDLPQFYHNKIKEFVGDDLTDEEFEKLAKYCSQDHLKTGAEIAMPVSVPAHGLLPVDCEEKIILDKSAMFQNTTNLCIHKKHKLRVDKDIGNHYIKKLKYRGIRLMKLGSEDSKTSTPDEEEPELVPGKDILFRVRIYRPYDYNIKYFRGRSRHAVFCCDAVVAGRQPLTALRDRFVCANDVGMRVDVADHPDSVPPNSAKEVFPSGFLFINNVFYVDTRPGCVDHATALRAWARRRGLGDFPQRDMSELLRDVPVRLGHPEVYVHQGNCEHLFTFSEVRLVGPLDPLRLSQYPGYTAASTHQTVYCTTCAEFCAKWVVVGCTRVPFDPAFFCETCFRLYLYKDGKKIGDFKAYCFKGNEINMLKPSGL